MRTAPQVPCHSRCTDGDIEAQPGSDNPRGASPTRGAPVSTAELAALGLWNRAIHSSCKHLCGANCALGILRTAGTQMTKNPISLPYGLDRQIKKYLKYMYI